VASTLAIMEALAWSNLKAGCANALLNMEECVAITHVLRDSLPIPA